MDSTPEPMKIYGIRPTPIYQMAIESQSANPFDPPYEI
jgi:hypothetical protein